MGLQCSRSPNSALVSGHSLLTTSFRAAFATSTPAPVKVKLYENGGTGLREALSYSMGEISAPVALPELLKFTDLGSFLGVELDWS